jgi:hypothetical protein
MSLWSQVLESYKVLDDARVDGDRVARLLREHGIQDVTLKHVVGEKGETDFVKFRVPGTRGRTRGGDAPTLGVVGRLGGVDARPSQIGFVSDGDGALTALSVACKIGDMLERGDPLDGDVIIATHICPNAATIPHEPVPFMDSPVDIAVMNEHEVDPAMDAVLSIDATKANRTCNHNGFAISPPVRVGWILKVSDDLMNIMQRVTGRLPVILPITMQDITPYGNGISHLNSIVQPATATSAPVVGVAITAEVAVAGNTTGATDLTKVEATARFCLEVAKDFGRGRYRFVDDLEFERLVELYGSMARLQSLEPALPGRR